MPIYVTNEDDKRPIFYFIYCQIVFHYVLYLHTVELQWLEDFWNHEKMFETGVVRANVC